MSKAKERTFFARATSGLVHALNAAVAMRV